MPDSAITALIGSSVAILGLLVAKETKVSEFRQEWIDALREDVSELCALSSHVQSGTDPVKINKWILRGNELANRIRLRQDATKPTTEPLMAKITHMMDTASLTNDFAKLSTSRDEVLAATTAILDAAWERVKRGEKRYVYALRVALIIAGCTLLYFLPDGLSEFKRQWSPLTSKVWTYATK